MSILQAKPVLQRSGLTEKRSYSVNGPITHIALYQHPVDPSDHGTGEHVRAGQEPDYGRGD